MRKLFIGSALLAASVTANAATYEVTLVEHLIGRGGNPPSTTLLQPAPTIDEDDAAIPMPACTFNDVTEELNCTGTFHFRSQTNPSSFGRIFDRFIADLNIVGGNAGGTTSYECVTGGFSQATGANFCGNYVYGDNFIDESSITYGPGLAFERTMGGDDEISGDPQTIADYDLSVASFTAGGQLVLRSEDWLEQPQTPADSAGTQLTFDVGEEIDVPTDPTVNDDTFSVLEGSTNTLNVLANDTDLPDGITIEVSVPDSGGSALVDGENMIEYSPDATAEAGDTETFTYTVLDSEENEIGTATVTINIEEDLLPAADDGTISISSQGGSTAAGTVDVSTLPGYSAGNAPATVSIETNADAGTEGACSVSGTTISFTRVAAFAAGGAEATCTYIVTDSNLDESDPGTITITVTNAEPTLANGSITGEQGAGDLVATGALTLGNGAAAQHPVAILEGDCEAEIVGSALEVSHPADTLGEFQCEVEITDFDGDSDTATFDFTVEEPAPEPEDEVKLPGGKGSLDLLSLALLGGLPLLRRRRRA